MPIYRVELVYTFDCRDEEHAMCLAYGFRAVTPLGAPMVAQPTCTLVGPFERVPGAAPSGGLQGDGTQEAGSESETEEGRA